MTLPSDATSLEFDREAAIGAAKELIEATHQVRARSA